MNPVYAKDHRRRSGGHSRRYGDRSPPAGSRGVAPIGDLGSPEAEASFVKIKVKFAFR